MVMAAMRTVMVKVMVMMSEIVMTVMRVQGVHPLEYLTREECCKGSSLMKV